MEREHLIIIALILVAIYMMNKDETKDVVKNVAPMGYIRNEEVLPFGHIRYKSHEGFEVDDPANADGMAGLISQNVRYSDKYLGRAQHIKNSIRYDNRDRMFNGMFSGAPQHIRYTDCAQFPQDC